MRDELSRKRDVAVSTVRRVPREKLQKRVCDERDPTQHENHHYDNTELKDGLVALFSEFSCVFSLILPGELLSFQSNDHSGVKRGYQDKRKNEKKNNQKNEIVLLRLHVIERRRPVQ